MIEKLKELTGSNNQQRMAEGEVVTPTTNAVTWGDAHDQCRHAGGRLPTKDELLDMVRGGRVPPGPPVWSGTSSNRTAHYMVGMINGAVWSYDDSGSNYVICVR